MTAYEKELKALWQAHLQPRRTNAPTVISLFAGAGGSSLGYSADELALGDRFFQGLAIFPTLLPLGVPAEADKKVS